MVGMLKKATSSVLAILPCSRTVSTLRASKGLRPYWTDFFDHSRRLLISIYPKAFMGIVREIFNRSMVDQEAFQNFFCYLLCMKADGIPGDLIGNQVIIDIQQVMVCFVEP